MQSGRSYTSACIALEAEKFLDNLVNMKYTTQSCLLSIYLLIYSICIVYSLFSGTFDNFVLFKAPAEAVASHPLTPRQSFVDKRIGDILSVKEALSEFHAKNGNFPASTGYDGYKSKYGAPDPIWIKGLSPGYIKNLPIDPESDISDLPGYIYKSDGKDYKLLAHQTSDCEEVKSSRPELIDPRRDCWAYGFWTAGAANW